MVLKSVMDGEESKIRDTEVVTRFGGSIFTTIAVYGFKTFFARAFIYHDNMVVKEKMVVTEKDYKDLISFSFLSIFMLKKIINIRHLNHVIF